MYEDIPRDLQNLRRPEIKILKEATGEGKRAYFSKSEPDKLYINSKYVKFLKNFYFRYSTLV